MREAIENVAIDEDSLYREDVFTDLKVGVIKRLTPVKADGTNDKQRQVKFLGQTQLISQAGPLPVSCEINAKNLKEAIKMFPEAINQAIVEMIEQVKEMQRKEASRIVVPGVETSQKILT
jgi:ribosomal protein L22